MLEMIQASEQAYIHYNYKRFDFRQLCYGTNRDSSDFINHEGVTFSDLVGRLYLTGHELLYYPELALKIRAVKEYPTIERLYKVNADIAGMEFIEYFHTKVLESFKAFEAEHLKASQEVDALLDQYGNKRKIPLIDRLDIEQGEKWFGYKKLVINGVEWYLDNSYRRIKPIESIYFESLFNIPSEFKSVTLEGFAVGTPFLALRLAKSWQHKGRVYWYSLDSRQTVPKPEVPYSCAA